MKLSNLTMFFMIAVMMFVSPAAMADPSGASSAKDVINEILNYGVRLDPSTNDVEYFQIWLSYIFGTFIFDTELGSSGTVSVLSSALGFVNLIALCFGFVMISYVFAGGALNSAHSGEVLGKNWSSVWMPIRTSVGLGFIMPAPAFGAGVLSFAQVAVIWLVIFGSNSGSVLWRNSVDKMVSYGVYGDIRTPSSGDNIPNLTKAMVCMDHRAKFVDYDNRKGKYTGATVTYLDKSSIIDDDTVVSHRVSGTYAAEKSVFKHYRYQTVTQPITFNLVKDKRATYTHRIADISPLTDLIGRNNVYPIKIEFDGCGGIEGLKTLSQSYVSHYKNSDIANDIGNRTQDKNNLIAYNKTLEEVYKHYHKVYLTEALKASWSMASEMGAILNGHPQKAANLARTDADNSANADVVKGVVKSTAANLVTAAQNYEQSYVKLKEMHIEKAKHLQSLDMAEFGRGGWAGAGVWFIKIGQLDRKINSSTYDAQFSFNNTANICDKGSGRTGIRRILESCEDYTQRYNATQELMDHVIKAAKGKSNLVIASKTLSKDKKEGFDLADQCSADSCELTNGTSESMLNSLAQTILNALTFNPMGDADPSSTSVNGGFFSATGLQNPFNTLQTIGTNLNNIAVGAFFIWGAANAANEALDGALSSVFTEAVGSRGITKFAGAILSMLGYALLPMLLSTLTAGFVLAYMIPFLPILAWINMMVGYLITVIEAVTAAPLAVVQLLTPEGQGILGSRLERAMQLLIVIMIKPTLMIIGLLSAIVVSSIAFSIFNEFFWQSSLLNLGDVGFIDVIALIIIYSSSALALTKLVVSIMYNLPDHILEWFAGGAARKFGEEATGEALKASTGAIGNAFSGAGSGVKTKIHQNKADKRADRQEAATRDREQGDQSRFARQMEAMGHSGALNKSELGALAASRGYPG